MLAEALPKFRATRAVYAETGLAQSAQELDRLVSRNVHYTVNYYRQLACLVEPRYRCNLQNSVRPQGVKNLLKAKRCGRGVILVAPHLGDFDLAVAWIAKAFGSRPLVPVARLGRPVMECYYRIVRRACSFDLVFPEEASVASLTEQLGAGRAVILTLDRCGGARTLEASLFGRPTQLPAACLTLARRAGAPLISTATWNRRGERLLAFGEPLGPGTNSEFECDASLMQHLARELEMAVRRAPEQWHIPARLEQLSIAAPSQGATSPAQDPAVALVRGSGSWK